MRVFFFDFDGVANSNEWLHRTFDERRSQVTGAAFDPAMDLDPERIVLINEIVEATGAMAVFSTSWRCAYSDDRLMDFLTRRGFKGTCVGRTIEEFPDGEIFRGREEEIKEWLECHDVESWVAIDDTNLKGLGENFIRTNAHVGIQPADVQKAIRVLNGEKP